VENVSKNKVRDLLQNQRAQLVGEIADREVWVLEDEATLIQLPKGNKRIDIEIVEEIFEQMGLTPWDLDYFLG